MKTFTADVLGLKMCVRVLPTPEDVARQVKQHDPESPDALEGAYLWVKERDRHLVWFAEETLSHAVIVHEAAHIGLRNMASPSDNYEEDLVYRIEEAYVHLATALRFRGLLAG